MKNIIKTFIWSKGIHKLETIPSGDTKEGYNIINLLEEFYEYVNKAKWISVEDQLPEVGDRVLACEQDGFTQICNYVIEPVFGRNRSKTVPCFMDEQPSWLNATHWMPLPERKIEINLGTCLEKNCNNPATVDYNGHQHYVCDHHYKILNDYFDDEYR